MRASTKSFERAKGMRRDMSLPEVLLWQELRGNKLGVRFRRQHPVGPFILDFYCSDRGLAIEVDGFVHGLPKRAEQDERRSMWLSNQGIRVMRFPAKEILNRTALEGVLLAIHGALAPSTAFGGPPPPPRGGGYAP